MKLSVIIVNYNVKYFLEQALHSVKKAMQGMEVEVIVVDNHSVDGSVEMVRNKFPFVKIIDNKQNLGFSKANNQAINISSGEYVLLLNPDTVVQEDCFEKSIAFMDNTPDAGALGVKMIDGSGKFLPESKRGLPTPEVAFYKVFGLASLFPKSPKFGKYHLGFLDKDKTNVVDVLAGAFMLIRKSTLDKTGLLDEDYFMYGEDIDLSYRITKAGYKNYYFPETTIIHYKGESTKRTSVNYVFTFYRAMIIFAKKHYSQKHANSFSLLINIAIYIRAFVSILSRAVKSAFLFILDFVLILSAIFLLKNFWADLKYDSVEAFPQKVVWFNSLVYSLLWMFGLYAVGAYNKRKTFLSILKGIAVGTLAITVFYAFASEGYRFSRALILLGACAAILVAYFNRILHYFLSFKKLSFSLSSNLKTIIVGNKEEVTRVQELLIKSKSKSSYLGFVAVDDIHSKDDHYLGHVSELKEIVDLFNVDELIFCSKDIEMSRIIEWMGEISSSDIMYKIVPEESLFIIGSNSKNLPGDFYTIEIHLSLAKSWEQQKKRIFDVGMSLLLLIFSPIICLIVKQRLNFIKNIFGVLKAHKTWVAYAKAGNVKILPHLKDGVLSPLDNNHSKNINEITIQKMNFLYAKDYSVEKDLLILLKSLRSLGNI